jgi:hypothetical protein
VGGRKAGRRREGLVEEVGAGGREEGREDTKGGGQGGEKVGGSRMQGRKEDQSLTGSAALCAGLALLRGSGEKGWLWWKGTEQGGPLGEEVRGLEIDWKHRMGCQQGMLCVLSLTEFTHC